jgi:nucleosome binding factor SPN SPT16 subunit
VILCSLGIRYKSYCSNVGRTFMIDPTPVRRASSPVPFIFPSSRCFVRSGQASERQKLTTVHDDDVEQEQEKNYLFVAELQKFALAELKDGVVCKDFYQKVVDKIQADRPDLAERFVKSAGFGVSPPLPFPSVSKCLRGGKSRGLITD